MITIEPNTCCACMACASICPREAIVPIKDDRGFVFPHVNTEKCVDCGLCEQVCDWRREKESVFNTLSSFAFQHSDRKDLKASASGGAFSALAQRVLVEGGCVYGAAWTKELQLRHVRIDRAEDLPLVRGTKYVQSDMGLIFRQVKTDIEAGRQVLFVGTPCQVAGLRNYMVLAHHGAMGNLYLVDFLCHGTPSNHFFRSFVDYIEQGKGQKVVEYSFRNKRYGWNSAGIEGVRFENDRRSFSPKFQSYNAFFYQNSSLRDSCYQCRYRSKYRGSDVTIADFWNIEAVGLKNDHRGCSMVLVHTEKGGELMREASALGRCVSVPVEKVKGRLKTSAARSAVDTTEFWSVFRQGGYPALVQRYYHPSIKKNVRFAVKKIVKRVGVFLRNSITIVK